MSAHVALEITNCVVWVCLLSSRASQRLKLTSVHLHKSSLVTNIVSKENHSQYHLILRLSTVSTLTCTMRNHSFTQWSSPPKSPLAAWAYTYLAPYIKQPFTRGMLEAVLRYSTTQSGNQTKQTSAMVLWQAHWVRLKTARNRVL